jgi:flagellar biosynthetic protein FliP
MEIPSIQRPTSRIQPGASAHGVGHRRTAGDWVFPTRRMIRRSNPPNGRGPQELGGVVRRATRRRQGMSYRTGATFFRPGRWLFPALGILFLFGALTASAQTNLATGFGPVQITLGTENGPQEVDTAIKVLLVLTLLTLAPAILLLMTCFTRIVIVLSFVRTALQLQGTPANQIIIGLSLFLTLFIMQPVWEDIQRDALGPYQAHQITGQQAMDRAAARMRTFMLRQTRPKDVELFAQMAKLEPTRPEDLPLRVVIPGFIISELRTAFQMGFLIFVPFILIDLVVATVLMSMGMLMMPPTTFSLPLKLLLFVLVDGWSLVVTSLVHSYGM